MFAANRPQVNGPCSIEIWLEPSQVDSGGTVVAFIGQPDGLLHLSCAIRNRVEAQTEN